MQNALYPFGSEEGDQDQGPIASNISGRFEGWSGQTVFTLRNGQVWQQVSPGYLYRYSYMPRVVIVPTAAGYRMKVEGVPQTLRVRRVR